MKEGTSVSDYQPSGPTLDAVIPAFNAQSSIVDALTRVRTALDVAGFTESRIIVIDDGSTDRTLDVVRGCKISGTEVHHQPNLGRLLARESGATKSIAKFLLFVDSRVWIHKHSLEFVKPFLSQESTEVWTCDVEVSVRQNPIARFWLTLEKLFWSEYYKNPRLMAITRENFDYVPKGTGGLIVPRELYIAASQELRSSEAIGNAKKINDDTAILRRILDDRPIMIAPNYSCTYFARTSLLAFLRHANHRGAVLIDGHWRKGSRLRHPITGVLITAPIGAVSSTVFPQVTFIGLLVTEALVILLLASKKVGWQNAVVVVCLSPLFTISYFAGMLHGVYLRLKLNLRSLF